MNIIDIIHDEFKNIIMKELGLSEQELKRYIPILSNHLIKNSELFSSIDLKSNDIDNQVVEIMELDNTAFVAQMAIGYSSRPQPEKGGKFRIFHLDKWRINLVFIAWLAHKQR